MRKRYQLAYLNPLPWHLARLVKSMIKYEKKHKLSKVSRSINYRSTWFTLQHARYILPTEKAVYDLCLDVPGLRTFAKGRNANERAEDLRKMYEHYPNPVVVLADQERFDARVNPTHLKYVHDLLIEIFGMDDVLANIIRAQKKNKGWTRSGIKFECVARRMSGDADTALGNSLINYMVLKFMYGDDALVYCDGDDSVIFLPHAVEPRSGTGFKTVATTTTEFEDIEFCQSYPLLTPKGWIMARDPLRAMTRMSVCCGKPVNLCYTTTIGKGEMKAQPYVAGVYELAELLATGGGRYSEALLEYQTKVAMTGWEPTAPTIESWVAAVGRCEGLVSPSEYNVVFNPVVARGYIGLTKLTDITNVLQND